MKIHRHFATLVREKRIKSGLTQLELAGLAGLKRVTICHIENENQKATFEQAVILSRILKISLQELGENAGAK